MEAWQIQETDADIYTFAQEEVDDETFTQEELAFVRGALDAANNFDEEVDELDY